VLDVSLDLVVAFGLALGRECLIRGEAKDCCENNRGRERGEPTCS
jgi:hypothetical protein